jgi:hypothetical protein
MKGPPAAHIRKKGNYNICFKYEIKFRFIVIFCAGINAQAKVM